VIRGFTFAMVRAVLLGTCSTIFVGLPRLLHLEVRRESVAPAGRTP
jgi:preprotein translocase subunit SecF